MKIREVLSMELPYALGILDRELLLAHVLGMSREGLIINSMQEVSDVDVNLYNFYVDRVGKGEPVAYVLNHKEFFGYDFYVDNRVLVPRPETEKIVELALEYMDLNHDFKHEFRFLDVGTGSGCIAVSVALALSKEYEDKSITVDAVDISDDALDVARINIEQYSLEDKVYPFYSDLLSEVQDEVRYDMVLMNLPYIGEVEHRHVEKKVEDFEPRIALFGGHNGLELYEEFFQQFIEKKMKTNFIVGEFCFGQSKDMEELLDNYFPGKWQIEKDLADIDRFFIVSFERRLSEM